MPPRKRTTHPPEAVEKPTEDHIDQAEAEDGAPRGKAEAPGVEVPCPMCFPAGWPEGSPAVGCEHGSWTR